MTCLITQRHHDPFASKNGAKEKDPNVLDDDDLVLDDGLEATARGKHAPGESDSPKKRKFSKNKEKEKENDKSKYLKKNQRVLNSLVVNLQMMIIINFKEEEEEEIMNYYQLKHLVQH